MLFKPSINNRRRYFAGEEPRHGKKVFIKRSVTPDESSRIGLADTGKTWPPPHRHKESLRNEALAIAFVQEHTSILVPNIITTFEDRDSFYIVQELVEHGIPAPKCPPEAESIIAAQLEKYMAELHAIKSDEFKSFVGKPFFPIRFGPLFPLEECSFPTRKNGYVLCHGDIGWQNVIVDPKTYEILYIIDWEYAGFYPVEMEGKYWRRKGLAHWNKPKDKPDGDLIAKLLFGLIFRPEAEASLTVKFPTVDDPPREPLVAESSNTIVESEAHQPEQSALQQKLLSLNIDHPHDQPVSMASINSQQLYVSRRAVGEDLVMLAKDMREEDRVIRGWRETAAGKKTSRSKPTVFELNFEFQVELAALLPPLFHELGEKLSNSAEHLLPHRDSVLTVKRETARLKKAPDVDDADRTKAIKDMNKEKRCLADQAARLLEMEKWQAVKSFNEKMLVIAHAAVQHFEWYPSYDGCPPEREDGVEGKRRWDFELRLRNLIADGCGGWKVGVREMTTEEYTPPKWD